MATSMHAKPSATRRGLGLSPPVDTFFSLRLRLEPRQFSIYSVLLLLLLLLVLLLLRRRLLLPPSLCVSARFTRLFSPSFPLSATILLLSSSSSFSLSLFLYDYGRSTRRHEFTLNAFSASIL